MRKRWLRSLRLVLNNCVSGLSDIVTYWTNSTPLNAAVPITQVYTGMVPDLLSFPYASLSVINEVPTDTTSGPAPDAEDFYFRVTVWDFSLANCESIMQAIRTAFHGQQINAASMMCLRMNYLVTSDEYAGQHVYSVSAEFQQSYNTTAA
jgi:hypothetical protein